jgi:hypothetical protein
MNKLNLKAKFVIQETTRGSAHKMYGPYHGKYVKYTAEEMKKAKASKGKVTFTMKPVVKLHKHKMHHKGGFQGILPNPMGSMSTTTTPMGITTTTTMSGSPVQPPAQPPMMPPVQSGMQPTMARGGSKNLKK